MAKLESAAEVIEIVKSGKYVNEVNAKRGVGRTRLSQAEKAKVFKFIEEFFGSGGEAPRSTSLRPGKRMAKVAKKKKVGKKAGRRVEPDPSDFEEELETTEAPAEEEEEAPSRKVTKKKVTRHQGTLSISPSEVKTVADVIQVVDSTVQSSVSVINALRQADEASKSGDISKGIELVKQALEGAARVLHTQVVVPLLNSSGGADQNVAARLEAVVAASSIGVAPEGSLPQPPFGVTGV